MFRFSQRLFCVIIVCLTYHVFEIGCGVIPYHVSNTLGGIQNTITPHHGPICDHHHHGSGDDMLHPFHQPGPRGGMNEPYRHHQGLGFGMHHHHHQHGFDGGMHHHHMHHHGPDGMHHHMHHHGPDGMHHHMHHHGPDVGMHHHGDQGGIHHPCPSGNCNHQHGGEINPHQEGPAQGGSPLDNTDCGGNCLTNVYSTSKPVGTTTTDTPHVVQGQGDSQLDVRFGSKEKIDTSERTLVVAPVNCPPGTTFDSRTERCRKSV